MTCDPGYGGLLAPQSLLDLEQRADLIVVGSASGASQVGTTLNFSLRLSRVLKGDAGLSSSVIPVNWTVASPDSEQEAAPAVGGAGLWFLKGSSNGWSLLPVVQGRVPLTMTYFPVPPGPLLNAYTYDAAVALSDKIAAELGSAIESANGTLNFQLNALQYGLLDQLNSRYTSVLYQRISTSTSLAQRIIGLSGLIRSGDAPALASAIQSASAFVTYAKENGILLLSIRDYFRADDSLSIAVLGQAAVDSTNPNVDLRQAVAHALAAMHTTGTLPYLAMLLDNQDVKLRVEAVGGIGSFANGLAMQTNAGGPSLAYLQLPDNAPYMTAETKANFALGSQAIERNETAYLSFWKQWWSQHRTSLGF
jgi:hypothetical protein